MTALSTNVFEGITNDYASVSLQRWGDTNTSFTLNASSFSFGGTAVLGTDYVLANLPFTFSPGVINATIPLIFPLKNSTAVGVKNGSIILTNVAGTGYTVPSAILRQRR